MKKIILGTLVLLTIGMGFGFAETQKKSQAYYDGYNHATQDYSKKDKDYNPSYCDTHSAPKKNYDCTQGYQDSWERNSEVAPRTPKENSNNQ